MGYRALLDDAPIEIEFEARSPLLRIRIAENAHVIREGPCSGSGEFELTLDDEIYHGWRYATPEEMYVRLRGRTFIVRLPGRNASAGENPGADQQIRTTMPAVVVAVHCARGEEVKRGQPLVTIESMKLQVTVVAPRTGVIETVHVEANQAVDRGAALVSLAPLPSVSHS